MVIATIAGDGNIDGHPGYSTENAVAVSENNVSVSSANMDLRLAWMNLAFFSDTPHG